MKKSFLVFVIICLVLYLLGCFVSLSFNIAEWSLFLRTSIGINSVLLGSVGFGISQSNQN